jgi:hypothetical protein
MDAWQGGARPNLRTSLIFDPPNGRLPSLTEQARQRQAARMAAAKQRDPAAGIVTFGNTYTRCILGNSAAPLVQGGNPGANPEDLAASVTAEAFLFQSPGYVTIVIQSNNDVRIIPLDGRPHLPSSVRQWWGDARGRWDGDTLVVETTNFKDTVKNVVPGHGGPFGGSNHVHYYPGTGETMRLVERFSRAGNTIEYRYTLEDPAVFVRPFTAAYTWHLDTWSKEGKQDRMFEYACHEHNYGMVNALAGARADRTWALSEAKREAAVRMKELQAKKAQLKQWEATVGSRRN